MENEKSLFVSQMIKHKKTLLSGVVIGIVVLLLLLVIASKSNNPETLVNVSSEANTPITFSIVFCIASLLLSLSFVFNHVRNKEKYNIFFFFIFNILLTASTPNLIANLYTGNSQGTFFTNISPKFSFSDALNFTAFPIVLLMLHIFRDVFHHRNYSCQKEPLSCLLYGIFSACLFAVYFLSSILGIVILCNIFV